MSSLAFEKLRRRMVRENRIYIMPTLRGAIFLTAVVILILVAATYNNNLIFILAFFLFALFAVTMLQTHYNINGVSLEPASIGEGFAGESLNLIFQLKQRRRRGRQAFQVRSAGRRFKTLATPRNNLGDRESSRPIQVAMMTQTRGVHPLPEMILETFYPLGLFRAWKVFRPQGQLIVYPRPEGLRRLMPNQAELGEEDLGLRASPEGDFGELKNYAPGESYHQIAWKHFARTGHFLTKTHWGQDNHHYVIEAQEPITEGVLKQMSLWIKHALDENATFEMHLRQEQMHPGQGADHARQAWRTLAGFKDNT